MFVTLGELSGTCRQNMNVNHAVPITRGCLCWPVRNRLRKWLPHRRRGRENKAAEVIKRALRMALRLRRVREALAAEACAYLVNGAVVEIQAASEIAIIE